MNEIVKRVQFVYFDAGGGHRAAATALKTVIEQQKRPWEITLVNLQETLHSLDVFRKTTGIRLEDIYNLMLAKGWTLGAAQGLKFMHAVIRLYHGPTLRLLERHWSETQPDLVVSLVPNFNRAMCESLKSALPNVPFVTILTDFADYPPHFWLERQEQFVICGTDKAVEQARSMGYPDSRIFETSGMILAAAVLRTRGDRSRGGTAETRARSAAAYGTGVVRRARLQSDARNCEEPARHSAHHDLREE